MNRVSVTIDGIEYQITGEKNEAEIVKVAKFIDGELKQISKSAPSLSKISAAILTSVNIADKLFDSNLEVERLKKEIEEITENYSSKTIDVEKEFDSVLSKLEEAEKNAEELGKKVIVLEHELSRKDEIIRNNSANAPVVVDEDYEKKIKSLELYIKEMENKVAVAESMATEFQNKAYNIQLNYEELKKNIK
ncbi:cell division protein ZapA [Peptostreptococcus porci]|uniref:cell division protein ZapA n=1 Tax=Peptostreptococcus porci TaxID=2652282 RepID=UPI0023F40E14|nr:cell division protein ZapA [Peptostreptococcus porci]MDD7183690.1 cell division protein ZapA [Peptostreptococcus porci]MDY4127444.1 cell division protein ZapA [Peptostreptococcus porci]MDY4560337.1 cell division protein ZapA [Peptostreptococcus porci]MDY5436503.1 cell division protein ZapA [Peptostreptococcus porci]MDY5964438.1 cell division protein ZapA [Peptostreptococcus porci]